MIEPTTGNSNNNNMINRSRDVLKMYLNEETYKSIKVGYMAVNKRINLTCAEELEELKKAINNGDFLTGKLFRSEPFNVVLGIKVDSAVIQKQYLLRAGHGGVLDSMATGVLAVGLCDGCKLMPYLLASSKRYTVTGKLGQATETYNNKGSVVSETAYDHVTRPMLEDALKEFEGEIWQTPPAFSGLKIKGKRASDIVSSGGEVSLRPRPVECHAAKCVVFEPPYFTLDISCGTGFYVRSLVHDLAIAVGSSAHVTELVRTKHGPFTLKDCLRPEEYSLSSVVQAVKEAKSKHPKLAERLRIYWEEREITEMKKKDKREDMIRRDAESGSNRQRRSIKPFVSVKNKLA